MVWVDIENKELGQSARAKLNTLGGNFNQLREEFDALDLAFIEEVAIRTAQNITLTNDLAAEILRATAVEAAKADLVDGKVPTSQLPSYVDSVVEYPSLSDFPAIGSADTIYVTLDTNLSYRWSGTTYAGIGSGLTLGETSGSAYRGDRGKLAYDHSLRKDNPHEVSLGQLGAGNAAALNVGTAAGTVAAGNDSRILGAAQKAANLSDIANKAAARANLELGAVAQDAVVPVARGGTGGTTQAAARTGLGLGSAAVQNVATFLQANNNFNDLTDLASAINNLGFLSAITTDSGFISIPAIINGQLRTVRIQARTGSVAGNNTATIAWPVPFSAVCCRPMVCWGAGSPSGDRAPSVVSYNVNGVTIRNPGATANVNIWAFGY